MTTSDTTLHPHLPPSISPSSPRFEGGRGDEGDSECRKALRWSRRDWAAIALLGLLVALFFWRILTPNLADRASFPPGDFSYQFWAFTTFDARELSAGRLPLWNPYTYAGAPFWADIQSAVFYPLSLLTLLLSGPWGFSLFALEVEAVVHFWLAGVFTYLFVRRLAGHRAAALLSAITFTFGGYLTGYPSQQLAVLEVDVWLPSLLYFTDRALVDRSGGAPQARSRPNLPDVLAAGLAWGMALLAGHPQSALFVFYTFTLYAAYCTFRAAYAGLRTFVFHWVPVAFIGFGLAAVAWLPGLEYMQLSVRAAGFYDKMAGGFPLYDPVQMLLPGSVSLYSPLYVGVLPLLVAIWAALSNRQRETIFWGALAAGASLLSFGGETFLYTPFYLLAPGFSIFRDQERVVFVFSFAMAVLAGYGLRCQISNAKCQISNLKAQGSSFRSIVGWLLVGSLGLVVLFFYALNNAGWKDDSPFNPLLSRSVWLAILLALIWGTVRLADSLRLRGMEEDITRRSNHPSRIPQGYSAILPAAYLLLTAFDLFTVNWRTNVYPALPETQTATPAVVQAIQRDATPGEIFRVYNEYRIYENYGVPYALEDAWGASPLRLALYDEMYHTLRMERLWELLNVKYVITWRKELYAPSEIIYQEPKDKDVTYVHRLQKVAPRAWLVFQAEEIGDGAALSRLDAFNFDPARTALTPPGVSVPLGHLADDQAGQVEIVRRTAGWLSVNITAPTDGLLVLSEVYYPGWQATVDGREAPIVRTDYTLRGIPVSAGEHRIEITYRPATVTWGGVVSGATLGMLIVAGLWTWLRRRRFIPVDKSASARYE